MVLHPGLRLGLMEPPSVTSLLAVNPMDSYQNEGPLRSPCILRENKDGVKPQKKEAVPADQYGLLHMCIHRANDQAAHLMRAGAFPLPIVVTGVRK